MHPIEQFEIRTLFPIVKIGNVEIAFTNSALYMLIAVAIIALLMIGFTSSKALVPGRLQAIAEISYEFIAANLQRTAGSEGMKFFSSGVLTIHVHSRAQRHQPNSTHVRGDGPDHHHGVACHAGVFDGDRLRLLEAWAPLPEGFCAERDPRLSPSNGIYHRGSFVPLAAAFAQRSLVRQHPCRPYSSLRVRRLRHHGERARHPRLVRSHRPAGHDSDDLRA